ncbi:DUF3307 domain-containing protein [Agaribacterium sp. ZY112]|uniref:DUF3307 domain-containing protein n=1 Tax=Agaribacterium sp. ZY112 TaxID=3233574 RepID=UPI003523C2BD
MSAFLILLLSLLILHVITDFYLQPIEWVKDKNTRHERSLKLLYHAIMQASFACVPILFFTASWRSVICTWFVVGVSHWLIDLWKTYAKKQLRYFVVDQALHVFILIVVALHAAQLQWSFAGLGAVVFTKNNLIIALSYILIFKPTSILIGSILTKYTPEENESTKGLISGGEVIGYLERTLILTFTITGQFTVIGFVLAAKSIFRFGDLNNTKNHKLTEYVLLGSLLSVTITSVIGLAVRNSI